MAFDLDGPEVGDSGDARCLAWIISRLEARAKFYLPC